MHACITRPQWVNWQLVIREILHANAIEAKVPCGLLNLSALWHQKQVPQAEISNYIPQFTEGCNYSSLPEIPAYALRWRHNGHDSVSNHQPHHCLLNRLFRCRSKKTSKLRVTGLCVRKSPGTEESPPPPPPPKWPVTRIFFPFDDVIMGTKVLIKYYTNVSSLKIIWNNFHFSWHACCTSSITPARMKCLYFKTSLLKVQLQNILISN